MNCLNCGIDISDKKPGAKFCSTNCRVTFSRKSSVVTDSVTFAEPAVTVAFEYTIKHVPANEGVNDETLIKQKNTKKSAKYWYDVPLAAMPVIKKDWPKMPDYMNGRQYFLWMKNEFATNEAGDPVLHNPYPTYTKLDYYQAGDNSRRWGA